MIRFPALATLITLFGRTATARVERKTRQIIQSENTECGLACLAMIASAFDYHVDINHLRTRFPISDRGTDLIRLIEIAGEIGLSAQANRAEPFELDQVELPCILHWDIDHFVVLTRIKNSRYTIIDPAYGERELSAQELGRHFSGILLELKPTENFQRANLRQRLKLTDLWSNIRGLKRNLSQIILVTFLLHLFVLASPLYLQIVVDRVVEQGYWDWLIPIALGFGLLVVTQAAINFLRAWSILFLSARLGQQMAANLFYHLIRLPLGFFIRRHLGDIVSRFGSLKNVRDMITNGFVSAMLDGVMSLFTISIMLYYSPLLTGLTVVTIAVFTAIRFGLYAKLRQLNQEKIVAAAQESSFFLETIHAVQTLKLFQGESLRQAQWLNRFTNQINREVQLSKWNIGISNASNVLFGIENILVILFAVLMVRDNLLSLGMVFAFLSFKNSFSVSFNNLITQFLEFRLLEVHFDRIGDIALANKEFTKAESSLQVYKPIAGKLEVENLGYCFEGEQEFVFRGVSFSIDVGESLAITGPSGCGKTTLIKCLMGLLTPTEGRILIDGQPLGNLANFRSSIAGVMQNDQLLSGSIRDNISFFSEDIDMEKIVACAKAACIHEDINKITMGYNTPIGDLGSTLSGGQKQRLLLARALYRKPKILFMDEATSHLDVEREAVVSQNIAELSITRVLVAHRPETVRTAGKCINLAEINRHSIIN